MKPNLKLRPELILMLNAAGIVLSAVAVTALLQVDRIVHGSLYFYGLIFNYEWATPYWAFFRLSLALLCGVAGVSFLSMLYVVLSRKSLHSQPPVTVPSIRAIETQPKKTEKEIEHKEPVKEPVKDTRDDGVEIVAIPMECNKCGKVFTQPLCMFDFRSGKPRLVNVCPYCNALLAVSGNSKAH
jgi:predicted Zn-ribbon and HTH transcriptional regulator